jgi:DNA-binding MarR family transcriptional regulator
VERVQCPNDGRAVNAQLTNLGLTAARQAQTTLRAAVQRDFLDALGGVDAAALAASFQRLLTAMETRRGQTHVTVRQLESVE